MKNSILLLLFTVICVHGFSQKAGYFQQETNYVIDVVLNDELHELSGTIEIEYINNSPDNLEYIYMHLWANAYKDRNTAFAKQKIRTNSTKFYFSEEKDLGNYSGFDFQINGKKAELKYDEKNKDIGILDLAQPLKPGESLKIFTPFTMKIPKSFSRMGRVGTSYQMSQWFPKPAVYDMEGWHPMPYVDMGEFYSEFGDFDVSITLPKNYVVASTGVLQNETEIEFLNEKIAATRDRIKRDTFEKDIDFPASSLEKKTIRYLAEDVHDFAWFADKRFHVQKSAVTLASGKSVDTYVFFTNIDAHLWKTAIDYVDRSTIFYSEKVGEYPYPHATAVESAQSANGGMEYPMITVIGDFDTARSLDGVITHEVGHNWFYGILGFNERDHGWLDEGINSYYDHRYDDDNYEGPKSTQGLPNFFFKDSDMGLMEAAYLFNARRNKDQAPSTHSEYFKNSINYGVGIYEKPAVCLKLMEKHLGVEKFDKIMQSFYQKWKFKHPNPVDFRKHVEAESGKNLDWFFDGFINSNDKMDYALRGLDDTGSSYQLNVKNKGHIASPYSISGVKDGKVVETLWYDGFEGKSTVEFPKGDYDRLSINEEKTALEIKRSNNHIRTSGPFKTVEPLKFKVIPNLESSRFTTLYWAPTIAWNNYDKTMLGLTLYNTTVPSKKFEFAVAPMYSLVTNDLNGLGNVFYNMYPRSGFVQSVTLGLGWKKFNSDYNYRDDYNLSYNRFSPSLSIALKNSKINKFKHRIDLRVLLIDEEDASYANGLPIISNKQRTIYEAAYVAGNSNPINPWDIKLAVEHQQYEAFEDPLSYSRISLEGNQGFAYKRGKYLRFRLFAGGFLQNSRTEAGGVFLDNSRGTYALTSQGYTDYRYDDFYFGRTDQTGIWTQQVSLREGGFKNALGSTKDRIGNSNSFILALNIKADLPMKLPRWLPLKPYFDIGYFDDRTQSMAAPEDQPTFKEQFMYSFGLMLDVQGVLSIHFPLINSEQINTTYKQNKNDLFQNAGYFNRVTFSLDLNRGNPFEIIKRVDF